MEVFDQHDRSIIRKLGQQKIELSFRYFVDDGAESSVFVSADIQRLEIVRGCLQELRERFASG